MISRILTVLLLLSASALAQNAPTLDETAHFLAGMPVTGVLEPLTHDPAWQEHAQAMNEAWTRKERSTDLADSPMDAGERATVSSQQRHHLLHV